MIDLRSDTVTLPDAGMRQAIAEAHVGDDVFGEDPSINELQRRVAELLGKEAALFVPSGQMGNQLAIASQTEPGDEVVLADNCHIVHYESAASSVLSGIQLATVPTGEGGFPKAPEIASSIRSGAYYEPRPRLIALENTINKASGAIFPQSEIAKIREIADDRSLKMHLDGARLWNASVASGVSPASLSAHFETVTVCLSKGLGAPVGSVLAGTKSTIVKAHRYRKMFGAGMRQAGFMAAAGLYALEHNIDRLSVDHRNAAKLATSVAVLPGVRLDLNSVQTNIVVFELESMRPDALVEELRLRGILMLKFGPRLVRAITHLGISDSEIEMTIDELGKILR